jgi:hypothetical protein
MCEKMKTISYCLFLAFAMLLHLGGCEVPISNLEQRELAGNMDEHLQALFVGTWYVDNPDVGTPCMCLRKEGSMNIVEYDSTGAMVELTGAWRLKDDIFTKIVGEKAQNFVLLRLTSKALAYEEFDGERRQYSFHRGN